MKHTSAIFVAVVLCLIAVCYGGVMGVDIGSEFIKIAAPKGDQIDIVLNEQTRRKSNNYVGFRADDRFIGEDAKNLAPRFPNNMFTMVNRLLGVSWEDPAREQYNNGFHHSTKLVKNEKRGTVDFQCEKNPNVTYTSEELMGMLVAYMKDMTEKDTENKITSAVFTVPSFYTAKQRQALVDAADLAGVKTLALMHSTTATALQYGMNKRGFGNDTVNVLIYDMGTAKTEVGVYTFSPTPAPKDGSRVKLAISLGTMTTRTIVSDPNLGGRTFDACIAKVLEDEFIEKNPKMKRVLGGDTLVQQKASFTLMRAAASARETLSANTATPVTVEGIAPGKDFFTKLTREDFEQKCDHLFSRVKDLAQEAISSAGIDIADISAFEMMGGGVRPPKITAELSEFLGRPVDRTLNSDEAAAMGAGYYGARLASFFRVKSFAIKDNLPTSIAFETKPDMNEKKPSAKRTLFENGVLGSRRSISLSRKEDFQFDLSASSDAGKTFQPYTTIKVTNVNDTLSRLGYHEPPIEHENNTASLRVQIRLEETGLLSIEESQAKFRYVVNVSKKIKVKLETAEGEASSEENAANSTADEEENQEDAETAAEGAANATADAVEGANATEGDANTTKEVKKDYKYETVYNLEMRKKTLSLDVAFEESAPFPMDSDDKLASAAILKALDDSDASKRATSAAKNDLETFIQFVKYDGILENEKIRDLKFMSEEEETAIKEANSAAQVWVEDDEGSYDDCTKDQFDAKLAELKNVTDVVTDRLKVHEDHIAEIKRNETIAKEKLAREAKKDARKKAREEEKKAKAEAKAKAAEEESKAQEGKDDASDEEKPADDDASKNDSEDEKKNDEEQQEDSKKDEKESEL